MNFDFPARVTACGLLMVASSASSEEAVIHGEDITQPVDRFDLRMQFKSLPDSSGFDDLSDETLTLRSDLLFFSKPDQLSTRFDLPLIWSNKPESSNPDATTEFGLGDTLLQAMFVHEIDSRWSAAAGLRTIVPTATGDAFGNGKLQLAPTVALSAKIPEISPGSYAALAVREFVSVAGPSSRSDINYLEIEPQFNIGLPGGWFLNSSPEIVFNFENSGWFVPLDLMIGKKFNDRWLASIEYQFALVRDDPRYDEWVECRLGYFF